MRGAKGGLVFVAAAMAALFATAGATAAGDDDTKEQETKGHYAVPPPPFSSEDIFPCTACHADLEVNTQRRPLTDFHDDIVLHHGPPERWCFDCHNPDNRDVLRLASGELIPFTESYRLCGQCHGDKYRDWKVGVHGKRTGEWNGKKQYLLCAHCHNPHSPHFAPIEPLPPPVRPSLVR
jgi:formate-dependent nitrite reductase cytochrome c552 subunit